MSRWVTALAAGLAAGTASFLGYYFSDEPAAQRPLPIREPAPVLASCADTLDEGAGAFNLTHVEVTANGEQLTWTFRYDGPDPASVQWSSVDRAARVKHVLAFGPTGEVTGQFVRDLRTGRQRSSALPGTYGSSDQQPSHVTMSFPAALVDQQSLRGAEAAVTVPGGRTDTCLLR